MRVSFSSLVVFPWILNHLRFDLFYISVAIIFQRTKFCLEIMSITTMINFKFWKYILIGKEKKEIDEDPPATSTKVQKVKRFLPVKFVAMFSFEGGMRHRRWQHNPR